MTAYLDVALDLLRRVNRWPDAEGRRLSAAIEYEGFEPWWFCQEDLYWYILVPYCRDREQAARALGGDAEAWQGLPADTQLALRSIGLGPRARPAGPVPGKRPGRWRRAWRRWRSVLPQSKLVALSLVSPVLFRLSGRRTVLYTIDRVDPGLDHDFRIGPIYRELRKRGYRFGEYVYHTAGYERGRANLRARGRPIVSLRILTETMDTLRPGRWLAPAAPARPAEPTEGSADARVAAAAAGWALRRAGWSCREIRALRSLLRLQGASRAVVLDDSRYGFELVVACKCEGIPVLSYMHGLLNRYHPGLMAYEFEAARRHTADLYGLWTPYFRARVLGGGLFEESKTFVSGPLRPPSSAEVDACRPAEQPGAGPVRVLLVSEPRTSQRELEPYIRELLADARFVLVVKTRPGESNPYCLQGGGLPEERFRIIQGGTVYEAFSAADVVLGTYSTVLYEAALVLRPAVVMDTRFRYGSDIVSDGLAEFASGPGEIRAAVLRAHALGREERERRRDAIWGKDWSDGAVRLFDEAERRLWPRRAGDR